MPAKSLPTYDMPPFDGIGANEYIVDVVHDVCDFISAVDTPSVWELNIWYHTLNCGFTTRISGETDFPCIYGERVGLGRVYVKLHAERAARLRPLGRRRPRRPQLLLRRPDPLVRFRDQRPGRGRAGRRQTQRACWRPSAGRTLKIKCQAAGLLGEQPTPDDIRDARFRQETRTGTSSGPA